MKKTDEENNYIIRLYEVTREGTHVTIMFLFSIEKIRKTDMIKEYRKEMQVNNNSFNARIGYNAIETFNLVLKK
jgi:alpha-mannosidase